MIGYLCGVGVTMDSLDYLAGVRVISIVAAGNRLNYHNFRMPDK